MEYDLNDQIHTLMETGLRPVSADDIERRHRAAAAPLPPTVRRVLTARRLTTVAIVFAAAGCAAAVVVGQLTGPAPVRPGRAAPTVLTAAYVRQLARTSRIALANSGQAVIVSRQTWNGVFQQASTDNVTYSGADWNDSLTYTPGLAGEPQSPESATNRVVDGQAYDYFAAADGLAWYHLTGPNAIAAMDIPDPRTLLAELAPAAGFVSAGPAVVDGASVTHLHATELTDLPVIPLRDLGPGGHLTALDVWVDGHGVVRRLSMTVAQQVKAWALGPTSSPAPAADGPTQNKVTAGQGHATIKTQTTTVLVTFLNIGGKPEVITAPPNAIMDSGLG